MPPQSAVIIRPEGKLDPVFISVGSNIGNRLRNCKNGISALAALARVERMQVSPFYQTEPVDYTDQHWFANAAVRVYTDIEPFVLLRRLKDIQCDAGQKEKRVRFGPRILDLDIVLYADRVLHSEALTIPHPRMHKRHFVLRPICDIDPQVIHPVFKKTVGELLTHLNTEHQRLKPYSCDC
jgi:2-amino-4-hydroxy-6-hydroxymethyldihydropteridine diphosphokinase